VTSGEPPTGGTAQRTPTTPGVLHIPIGIGRELRRRTIRPEDCPTITRGTLKSPSALCRSGMRLVIGSLLLTIARSRARSVRQSKDSPRVGGRAQRSSSGARGPESRELVVPSWCQDVLTRGVREPTARHHALQHRRSKHIQRSRWYAVNAPEKAASSTPSRTRSRRADAKDEVIALWRAETGSGAICTAWVSTRNSFSRGSRTR
jgi:hypothetical protein